MKIYIINLKQYGGYARIVSVKLKQLIVILTYPYCKW
jgi:hypothetical protein